MGTHNRITKEKYQNIKTKAKRPEQDAELAKEFEVSISTIRNIRRTKNYEAYLERVLRFHGNPKSKKTVAFKRPKIATYRPNKEAWNRMELLDNGPINTRAWALLEILPAIICIIILIVAIAAIICIAMECGNG